MTAARNRAFNGRSKPSASRNAAIAAVQINWKQISPGGDRDERLAWISAFLGHEVASLTDLTDAQLGAVAGELKRLTGRAETRTGPQASRLPASPGNVVHADFHRDSKVKGQRSKIKDHPPQTIHLASPEQVHTLEKLASHIGWRPESIAEFIRKRILIGVAKRESASVPSFRMLTFKQATATTNALLKIAGHRDLKKQNGGKPVSRTELNKYIPQLKARLRIDQSR